MRVIEVAGVVFIVTGSAATGIIIKSSTGRVFVVDACAPFALTMQGPCSKVRIYFLQSRKTRTKDRARRHLTEAHEGAKTLGRPGFRIRHSLRPSNLVKVRVLGFNIEELREAYSLLLYSTSSLLTPLKPLLA